MNAVSSAADEIASLGQTTLVLQGGGALGAYQVGVIEALQEAGIKLDWVIGTSIGAINAGLVAGNPPEDRMDALGTFWDRVTQHDPTAAFAPWLAPAMRNASTILGGLPGFFAPNMPAFASPFAAMPAEAVGYYSTDRLRATLSDLIDFDHVGEYGPRLTVGAASLRDSRMHYFDSRDGALRLEHVMASGALPPAFPPVRIDGELYWDGGVLSNTPLEAALDDAPRRDGVIFTVQVWNPEGAEPRTVWEVMNRQKDVQYSSRAESHITRQRQIHRLRHIISDLAAMLPEEAAVDPETKRLTAYGCLTRMHVIRLLAPVQPNESHLKDIDFSAGGIAARREAGLRHTRDAIARAPWRDPFDPTEGLVFHDTCAGETTNDPKQETDT